MSGGTNPFANLRGASRLAIDAVAGVTDIAEDLHRSIAGVAPIVGDARRGRTGRTTGITGLVYRSVRGVTRAVGFGLDTVFGQLAPLLRDVKPSPRGEAVSAALNGVFGDYLDATANPLAIPMQLRVKGRALALESATLSKTFPASNGRLLVLVHGLCMNDLQWSRDGHDHGAALAQQLGVTPLYLHYNTGRRIAANGEDFSAVLDQLVKAWPVPVAELIIVCHSMGGLVTRSACAAAKTKRHGWLGRLKKLVFLGTPHHGAPLERAGHWVDILLGVSPYTAPFARLGKVRSAGIKDLRYGNFLPAHTHGMETLVPMPKGVPCFVAAATSREAAPTAAAQEPAHRPAHLPTQRPARLSGDGLVPVRSALGQHKDAARSLPIPAARQAVFYGTNHFDLLSSRAVAQQLTRWLA